MKDYDPTSTFASADVARGHDVRGDEAECVAFLEQCASGGRVLELGIGTGRIALPLAARGLHVDGIDFSETMVERLREKPGGLDLGVQVGDFTEVAMEGPFALIFVVWNSFFNVLTQRDQVRCFRNVASQLTEQGVFVLEAYVPAFPYRWPDDEKVETETLSADEVRIGVLRHDRATQILEQSHVKLSSNGLSLNPVVQRYAWPSELDLMAELAGMHLAERWGGWRNQPFDKNSELHVSVYARGEEIP